MAVRDVEASAGRARRQVDVLDLVKRARDGDPRAAARLISFVEDA